jgi:hypothetical protein
MAKILSSIEAKKIYSRYPALARTRTWVTIDELLNAGQIDSAWSLAEKVSKASKQINAQNITARKLRVERLKFFALQGAMIAELQSLMQAAGKRITDQAQGAKPTPASLRDVKRMVTVEMGILRRAMMKWVTDAVWGSVEMGFRNVEAALLPVFKDNQECLDQETWKEMNLMEERLTFSMAKTLANNGTPQMAKSSQAYQSATDNAYRNIVKKNNAGLQLFSRIWDLTKRSELDLQRILERDISIGTSSRDLAKNVKGYLSDEPVSGPGVYTKPMANAMRMARTEMNRAYVAAQAEWAKTRGWVDGLMVTLSSAHDGGSECDCEANAGKVMDPETFADTVPFHPHCMCYATVVIKDEYVNFEEGVKNAVAVL